MNESSSTQEKSRVCNQLLTNVSLGILPDQYSLHDRPRSMSRDAEGHDNHGLFVVSANETYTLKPVLDLQGSTGGMRCSQLQTGAPHAHRFRYS